MQLASSGLRALAPARRELFNRTTQVRNIHIPPPSASASAARTASSTTSSPKQFLATARTLFSRFVAHAAAPGLGTVPTTSFSTSVLRSGSNSAVHATRGQTIQQGLSLPARHALSRPLRPPHLARPPVIPRNTTQVGLGCVRNFSSARPIFAHLAENVPVAGRALYEADWELKVERERQAKLRMKAQAKEVKKQKSMLKAVRESTKLSASAATGTEAKENAHKAELERYFAVPEASVTSTADGNEEGVTTYLYIPLASTPSSHMPLPASLPIPTPTTHPPRLLPLSDLARTHQEYSTHALRVSALFARLDAAHVWERGATSDAYGDVGGQAVVLRVTMPGWSAKAVRSVIGEAGTGWCAMEQVYEGEGETDSLASGMETPPDFEGSGPATYGFGYGLEPPAAQTATPPSEIPVEVDPAQSMVLPTLDFSSAFLTASDRQSACSYSSFEDVFPPSTTLADAPMQPTSDAFSDVAEDVSDSDGSSDGYLSDGSDSTSWSRVSFSSDFVERARAVEL